MLFPKAPSGDLLPGEDLRGYCLIKYKLGWIKIITAIIVAFALFISADTAHGWIGNENSYFVQ